MATWFRIYILFFGGIVSLLSMTILTELQHLESVLPAELTILLQSMDANSPGNCPTATEVQIQLLAVQRHVFCALDL